MHNIQNHVETLHVTSLHVPRKNAICCMSKLLGIALILLGVYFLGQNIIFATTFSPYIWRDIPAAGSLLSPDNFWIWSYF
jgi:hypothetical protein